MSGKKSCVFGPVPSRRLGRSLGVDLVPYKTCSYNCVYCQLGQTTEKTIERKEYVPVVDVLKQLGEKLQSGPKADYITLSGSGEPTLHSGCGEIINGIRSMTDIPVAVLTNGSLLWGPEVRQSLMDANLVIPSLDAGDAAMFRHVNRPHPAIGFDRMLEGLVQFSRGYHGRIWLEVFLLEGMNAFENEVGKIEACAAAIAPERIQLNTVARPPAFDFAAPVPEEKLKKLAKIFGNKGEVVADFSHVHEQHLFTVQRGEVLALIERRPCTLDDVSAALEIHRNEAVKHLEDLLKSGQVTTEKTGERLFYKAVVHPREVV